MGWETTRERLRKAGATGAPGDLSAATALSAATLPAAGTVAWVQSISRDDYGVGLGGAPAAAGVLCLLVLAPLLLPFLGLVQACVLTLPSVGLARGLPGPAWLRYLSAPVALTAFWGGLAALLLHWPLTTTVPVLTALVLPPTLAVPYVRRRAWRRWGLWWRAALASAGLTAAALGLGVLATTAGLIRPYEPPRLTTAQLAGVWRGENGAELRLRPDGRAEARELPTEPTERDWSRPDREYAVCAGSGTWEPDADPYGTDRAGILLHLGGACGLDTHWSVSGTETAPRLFVLFGDPDAGTLRILERAED